VLEIINLLYLPKRSVQSRVVEMKKMHEALQLQASCPAPPPLQSSALGCPLCKRPLRYDTEENRAARGGAPPPPFAGA